jgi:hypothetical protein
MRSSTAHRTCWFVVAGGFFAGQKAEGLSVRLATGKATNVEGHGPTMTATEFESPTPNIQFNS